MKPFAPRLASALLAAVLAVAAAATAHAQTGTPQDPYIITTPGFNIDKPGYYRLGNNINYPSSSGFPAIAILISASNVTLDLNGFYIAGPNTASSIAYGIYASERSNITIFNGTVAYFYNGIVLTGNGSATTNNVGHHLYGLRTTYCFHYGIEVDNSPGTLIEKNQISQIGGTTVSNAGTTFGIYFQGSGGTMTENVITKVSPASGGAAAYGISAGTASFASRNTVANCSYGVYCLGKYQDNLTYGCTTPYGPASADAGGNN